MNSDKQCDTIENVILPARNVLAFTTTRGKIAKNISFTNSHLTTKPHYQINPYQSFNLGLHVGDDETQVLNNRQKITALLPQGSNVQWLEQVHGADVHIAKTYHSAPISADALYTQEKHLALAIMTADCLPVLLSSKKGDEIAAVHCGWRPLAKNILSNTLKHFTAPSDDIVAWLGPCISPKAFEVGQEVFDSFIRLDNDFAQAFSQSETSSNHYFANLALIAKLQLAKLGVKTLIENTECTYQNPQRFYSYRRDNTTGRMASVICRL